MRKQKTINDLRTAECWIFDLDNTLYPHECDLFPQVERRMTQFMRERLQLTHEQAYERQKYYFHNYGTTLKGLMEHDAIDPHEFLEFVHDIDYSILSYNAALDNVLARLPGRKFVFTNGSENHAHKVLNHLRIDTHFNAIFDIIAADFTPKPHAAPYDALLTRHNIKPTAAVMVEDIAKNLSYPYARGMATLWIENAHAWCQAEDETHIDFSTKDLAAFLNSQVMGEE